MSGILFSISNNSCSILSRYGFSEASNLVRITRICPAAHVRANSELVRSSVDLSRTISEISFPATGEKTYTIHSNVPPSCDDLLISYKGALLQRAINSPIASFGVALNQLKLLIYPRDNRVHASHNIVGIQVLKHSHSLERNTKNQ